MIRDLIRDPVRDPIHDPIRDPVRDLDPVRSKFCRRQCGRLSVCFNHRREPGRIKVKLFNFKTW